MRRAVIYYSLSGNTHAAAETIAAALQADLIRIDTAKPMPESFSQQILYGGMQATFGLKPEITGIPDDLHTYDELIVGTPVWAGKHSPAVHTLLQDTVVREKVTAVFILSGGGKNEKLLPRLHKLLPNLKYTVHLADRKLQQETENREKLLAFLAQLQEPTGISSEPSPQIG